MERLTSLLDKTRATGRRQRAQSGGGCVNRVEQLEHVRCLPAVASDTGSTVSQVGQFAP